MVSNPLVTQHFSPTFLQQGVSTGQATLVPVCASLTSRTSLVLVFSPPPKKRWTFSLQCSAIKKKAFLNKNTMEKSMKRIWVWKTWGFLLNILVKIFACPGLAKCLDGFCSTWIYRTVSYDTLDVPKIPQSPMRSEKKRFPEGWHEGWSTKLRLIFVHVGNEKKLGFIVECNYAVI